MGCNEGSRSVYKSNGSVGVKNDVATLSTYIQSHGLVLWLDDKPDGVGAVSDELFLR
jgi:hypothetical protein